MESRLYIIQNVVVPMMGQLIIEDPDDEQIE